ncbi:MAG TPA: hypothetical protein VF779_19480 [Pyrinomonadaceae bacterium]
MNTLEQIREILATYSKHGWRLKRLLLTSEARALLTESEQDIFADAREEEVEDSTINALWFARPSHAGREAWELRLVAETPYALFETFEADEEEAEREEVRREMEARLREYAARS